MTDGGFLLKRSDVGSLSQRQRCHTDCDFWLAIAFESVLRFAYGYRDIIIADNANLNTVLPDGGRWTLDLSASGLWNHLNYWGRTGKLLSVRCDTSKPLESIAAQFTGDDNDPGISQARMKHNPEPLGWKLL